MKFAMFNSLYNDSSSILLFIALRQDINIEFFFVHLSIICLFFQSQVLGAAAWPVGSDIFFQSHLFQIFWEVSKMFPGQLKGIVSEACCVSSMGSSPMPWIHNQGRSLTTSNVFSYVEEQWLFSESLQITERLTSERAHLPCRENCFSPLVSMILFFPLSCNVCDHPELANHHFPVEDHDFRLGGAVLHPRCNLSKWLLQCHCYSEHTQMGCFTEPAANESRSHFFS